MVLYHQRVVITGELEQLTEQLLKVRTFRANMEKVEAEVLQLQSQLQDLKSQQKIKDEAAEREMYEEGIRCNKIVAQARMKGMNTEALEHALKQRVQKMDKDGNRIGLSQLESLVTLVVDTMRGVGASKLKRREDPEELEETRAPEELQLPNLPAGARGGQAPRTHFHRSSKISSGTAIAKACAP